MKRQHLRILVAERVTMRDQRGASLSGQTRDLSVGGLFLAASPAWRGDEHVELVLEYKGAIHVTSARVVRADADGVALRFWNPSAEFRAGVTGVLEDVLTDHQASLPAEGGVGRQASARVLWRRGRLEYDGELIELGSAGASIESVERPALGEVVFVLLPLGADSDDGEPHIVGCAAQVTRELATGFAVRFEHPSAEFRLECARFAASRLRA